MACVAAAAAALAPAPAMAAEGAFQLDFLETVNTRLVAPGRWVAVLSGGTPEAEVPGLAGELNAGYGLTDSLMIAVKWDRAPLATNVGAGLLFAPHVEWGGWTWGLQALARGGTEPAVAGGGILAYGRNWPALGGEGELELSLNLTTTRRLADTGLSVTYAGGVALPVLGRPADGGESAPSWLRVGLEAQGDWQEGSHYLLPTMFVAPSANVQLGLGYGIKLAGGGRPSYIEANAVWLF